MRWLVLVGSMTAVVACTSPNPAYEATADGIGQDASEGDPTGAVESTSTTGSTHADASSGASSDTTSESSTGDLPLPQQDPLCRFDLFAVNEMGQLHVLDPDMQDSRRRLEDLALVSWAIATEPSTGILYVNQRDAPHTIVRVDPFVPEILPDPLVIDVQAPLEPLETTARASFRGENELWIGTHETHRFVWVPPGGGTIGAHEVLDAFPRGGDMVFIEGGCAVVATLDGLLHSACFPAMPGPVPVIEVEGLDEEGLQFTGIAIDEQDRLWLSTADPNPGLVHIERARQPWTLGVQIPYDITMNDLATVIHRDDC